jgi:hypothetical protein
MGKLVALNTADGATGEQKVPFEVMCLVDAVRNLQIEPI